MREYAIRMDRVEKQFGKKKALDGLTLTVPTGCVYALLGNNGAGKSTAVKLLTGRLLPDAGTVEVLGLNPGSGAAALRRELAGVYENQRLFENLSVREYCAFQRDFYPDWDGAAASDLIRRFDLPERGRIGCFSRGMYAKTALTGVLARRPRLLFLDDPTLGLDTLSRREFMDAVLETLPDFEHSVFVTSHLLPEWEGLCDRIGILRSGGMRVEADWETLKNEFRAVRFDTADVPSAPGELKREIQLGETTLFCRESESRLAVFLREKGLTSYRFRTLTLEEIYLLFA